MTNRPVEPQSQPSSLRRYRWATIRQRGFARYFIGRVGPAYLMLPLAVGFIFSWIENGELNWKSLISTATGAFILTFPIVFLFAAVEFFDTARRFIRKIKEQRCHECNYDLRGSIEAGRGECPECGCLIERLN